MEGLVKSGDLVKSFAPLDLHPTEGDVCKTGVILTWVRLGGPEGTIWEVLFPEGVELRHEDDLEVLNAA